MEQIIGKVESFWNCIDMIKANKSNKIKFSVILAILIIPVYLLMIRFAMKALVCVIFQSINILFFANLTASIVLIMLLVLMILILLHLYDLLN